MLARQQWRRLGQIVTPKPTNAWWHSHASYPTALVREDGLVDVYFSVRDHANRSSVTRTVLDISQSGFEVVEAASTPLLMPGARGTFDADGVTAGCVIRHDGRLYLYYLGWTVGVSVPFTNFIGLAIADPGASQFRRYKTVPIIGRSEANPLTVGYPWVLPGGDGGFRMWFGSHLTWGAEGLQMEHAVKSAGSSDGLVWQAEARTVVPLLGLADPAEFAVSRPTVLLEPDGTLSMWYARRRPHYEIGFAKSDDGLAWQRQDAAVAFVGEVGAWEQSERTYPCVFDHRGRRFMLYNGDGYGRAGFGLAVLEEN